MDPGATRPYWYGVNIDVPVTAGQSGIGSINLLNEQFVCTMFSHQILGNTGDPETSGLHQDGQYTIQLQDEVSQYQNIPVAAENMFGSQRAGDIRWAPYPIPFAGNKTITFTVTNQYNRILTPESDHYTVQLVMSGFIYLGTTLPQR